MQKKSGASIRNWDFYQKTEEFEAAAEDNNRQRQFDLF
jgi:hypothetical protein